MLNYNFQSNVDVWNPLVPPASRYQSDHRRKWATPKWLAALHQEMQTMIGQQLRVQCELPQELSPDMMALLLRMDQQHSLKA